MDEQETPLPRSWSPKDKFSYIGLSQNNLRVHYKGAGRAACAGNRGPRPARCSGAGLGVHGGRSREGVVSVKAPCV